MKVKQLVWALFDAESDTEQVADTSFGRYIVFLAGKLWRLSFNWGMTHQSMGKFDNEAAAKAAAQADFERRVRECLESANDY